MFRRMLVLALCSSMGLVACGDSGPKDEIVDEEKTGDVWPDVPKTADGPGKGTDGFDFAADTRPSSQARGGRQPESPRLIFGEDARCRPGDWILENDHLRACVADVISIDALSSTGGGLLDLVPTSNPQYDELDFFGTSATLREGSADHVELVSDGSDGGPAVVRVTGVDLPLRLIVGTLGVQGSALLSRPSNLEIVTEFRLGPDSSYLEMTTWIESAIEGRVARVEVGTFALLGDLLSPWTSSVGARNPLANDSFDMLALFGSAHTWGYISPEAKTFSSPLELLGPMLYVDYSARGLAGTNGPAVTTRYITVVEKGSTDDLIEAFGDVYVAERPSGSAVQFQADEGPGWRQPIWSIERVVGETRDAVTALRFDGVGERTTTLPDGDYVATPIRWPSSLVEEVAFSVSGEGTVQLPSPGFHKLTVEAVRDDLGEVIPAQLRIAQTDGSHQHLDFFVAVRDLEVPLPPGQYEIEFSRGEGMSAVTRAYDLSTSDVTVDDIVLTRNLERDGWVSGDFHQHAMRSADSEVRSLMRLYSNLGAGLDVMGASDHDVVEDYAGIARDFGVDHLIHILQGSEVSPLRGHINVFPTPYSWFLSGFGAPSLVERDGERELRQLSTREILAKAVEEGVELIQINHGRDQTSALMNHVRYNPVTNEPEANVQDWPEEFHSMEIYNRSSAFCVLFRDWQSMLLHGEWVAAVGNSDTHSLNAPVGYPRNWLFVGDDQDALSDTVVMDAIKALRVSTSGGILIRWDGHLPGDTVEAVAGLNTIAVTVDVPEWSSVQHLTLVVNGNPVEERPVDPAEMVDGYGEFEFDVNVDADAIVTVVAWSQQPMSHVLPGRRPWGFVNPLFLDVGGDGWTAPGEAVAANVGLLQNVPFCSNSAELDYDPHAHFHSHDEDNDPHYHHEGHHHHHHGGHSHAH